VVKSRRGGSEERNVMVIRSAAKKDDKILAAIGKAKAKQAGVKITLPVDIRAKEQDMAEATWLRIQVCFRASSFAYA
jgi:hypothetical protein